MNKKMSVRKFVETGELRQVLERGNVDSELIEKIINRCSQ